MKPKERDETLTLIKNFFDDGGLISRLDERTLNYGKDLSDINSHLSKLNDNIVKHAERLTAVETKVDERTVSKISKRALTGYSGIIIVVATLIFYLGQARGWW